MTGQRLPRLGNGVRLKQLASVCQSTSDPFQHDASHRAAPATRVERAERASATGGEPRRGHRGFRRSGSVPVNVAKSAARCSLVADQPFQGFDVGEAAVAHPVPNQLAIDVDAEHATNAGTERHFVDLQFEGRKKLLRHPCRPQEPLALRAVGDGDPGAGLQARWILVHDVANSRPMRSHPAEGASTLRWLRAVSLDQTSPGRLMTLHTAARRGSYPKSQDRCTESPDAPARLGERRVVGREADPNVGRHAERRPVHHGDALLRQQR